MAEGFGVEIVEIEEEFPKKSRRMQGVIEACCIEFWREEDDEFFSMKLGDEGLLVIMVWGVSTFGSNEQEITRGVLFQDFFMERGEAGGSREIQL